MMNELIDTLHVEQCSLVVLHEGNIVTFNGKGVRKLYDIMEQQPELLYESKVADKAVGRTAARAMVEGGVTEVYADVISEQALQVLEDANIRVNYDRKVDHNAFLRIWEKMDEC